MTDLTEALSFSCPALEEVLQRLAPRHPDRKATSRRAKRFPEALGQQCD